MTGPRVHSKVRALLFHPRTPCWFLAFVEPCPGVMTSCSLDKLLFSSGARALSLLSSSGVHHLFSLQTLSFLANRLHSPQIFESFTPMEPVGPALLACP